MRKRMLGICLLLALLLTGCGTTPEPSADPVDEGAELPVEVSENTVDNDAAICTAEELATLLADIYAAVPGTADSTLKAVYAAGELLDYTMSYYYGVNTNMERQIEPEWDNFEDFVCQWVAENVPAEDAVSLVLAWDAVMTRANALMEEDPETLALLDAAEYTQKWDGCDEKYLNWQYAGLSPLYTQLFDRVTAAPYQKEPGDFAAVSADRFNGLWLNSEEQTLLIFCDGRCRVVYPALSLWGEVAGAYRVRDRSALGYCPALEIDFRGEGINEDGDFCGPLAYYVSGMDDTHFWCNSQWERFDRIDLMD